MSDGNFISSSIFHNNLLSGSLYAKRRAGRTTAIKRDMTYNPADVLDIARNQNGPIPEHPLMSSGALSLKCFRETQIEEPIRFVDRYYNTMSDKYIVNLTSENFKKAEPTPPSRGSFGQRIGQDYKQADNTDKLTGNYNEAAPYNFSKYGGPIPYSDTTSRNQETPQVQFTQPIVYGKSQPISGLSEAKIPEVPEMTMQNRMPPLEAPKKKKVALSMDEKSEELYRNKAIRSEGIADSISVAIERFLYNNEVDPQNLRTLTDEAVSKDSKFAPYIRAAAQRSPLEFYTVLGKFGGTEYEYLWANCIVGDRMNNFGENLPKRPVYDIPMIERDWNPYYMVNFSTENQGIFIKNFEEAHNLPLTNYQVDRFYDTHGVIENPENYIDGIEPEKGVFEFDPKDFSKLSEQTYNDLRAHLVSAIEEGKLKTEY